MPLSGSSCNLVISSVSPGENGLLPLDKETKGQEEQGMHGGWLSSGETHPAEWRAVISGGEVFCFSVVLGIKPKALCSLPKKQAQFKAGSLTLQLQSDP